MQGALPRNKFSLSRLGALALLALVLMLSRAEAIVLAPATTPASQEPDTDEADGTYFPTSAFGQSPEDPERLEIERDRRFRGRAPAGLVTQEVALQSRQPPKVDPVAEDRLQGVVFDPKNASQEVSVIATELGFKPKTIFASRDVPLRIFLTGSSSQTLCFMMDQFKIKRQVRSSRVEEIQLTPTQPGFYRYYCPINNLEGTLVVRDLTHSSPRVSE